MTKDEARLSIMSAISMALKDTTLQQGFEIICKNLLKLETEMQKNGLALQSDMDKIIEQNIQLKKQIEKLKCCRNCKKLDNRKVECSEGSDLIYFFGENCDKWEIKEK